MCPLVPAVLARGVCAVIPLFFYTSEITAAGMLLFLRKSVAMDILTLGVAVSFLARSERPIKYSALTGCSGLSFSFPPLIFLPSRQSYWRRIFCYKRSHFVRYLLPIIINRDHVVAII